MKIRFLARVAILTCLFGLHDTATALTTEQFGAICDAGEMECGKHPVLNAYVGGALDLIAVLDEQTDYLGDVYCGRPDKLFDVPAIIAYIVAHRDSHADKNAMLLLVRYLEENGGC
tara:strand:- start:37201 stop:37548 length:348 start_codon:yes stop_codon:yes gene_type:complete